MEVFVRTVPATGAGAPINHHVGRLSTLLHCGAMLSMALEFMDGDSIPRNLDEPQLDPGLAAFDQFTSNQPDTETFARIWNAHFDWMTELMPKLRSGARVNFTIPTDPDTIREDVRNYLVALIADNPPQSGQALIAAMNSLRWAIAVIDSLGGAMQNGGHTALAGQMQEAVEFFKSYYEGLYQVYEQAGEASIKIQDA